MQRAHAHKELEKIHALAYHSQAACDFAETDLIALAAQAADNNNALKVGGFLCYNDGLFFQYLEGDPASVEQLMSAIRLDPRHKITQEVPLGVVGERHFPEWRMRYLNNIDLETCRIEHSTLDVLVNLMGPAQNSAESPLGGVLNRVVDMRKRQEIEELERSNKELNRFAALAAHDIGGPLKQMGAFATLLREDYASGLDDDGREYLQYIESAANQLSNLVKELLSYAKLEGHVLKPVAVDMQQLMQSIVDGLRLEVKTQNATVHFGQLPKVLGDVGAMRQLMTNLLSNALKYRSDRDPVISIDAIAQGRNWLFSVTDNGIGIDEAYLGDVFTMFKRVATEGDFAGTGIGLAICERVVINHGGRIWVESVSGEGSEFKFTIPQIALTT